MSEIDEKELAATARKINSIAQPHDVAQAVENLSAIYQKMEIDIDALVKDTKGNEQRMIRKKFEIIITDHPDVTHTDRTELIRNFLQVLGDNAVDKLEEITTEERTRTKAIMKKALRSISKAQLNKFFETVETTGFKDDLEELINNHISIFPPQVKKQYKTWKNDPAVQQKHLEALAKQVEGQPGVHVARNLEDIGDAFNNIFANMDSYTSNIATEYANIIKERQDWFDSLGINAMVDHVKRYKSTERQSGIDIALIQRSSDITRLNVKFQRLKTIKLFDEIADEMQISHEARQHIYCNLLKGIIDVKQLQQDIGIDTPQNIYEGHEELWITALSNSRQREKIFKHYADNQVLVELFLHLNSKHSNAPEGTVDALYAWCEEKNIDLGTMLQNYDTEITAEQSYEIIKNELTKKVNEIRAIIAEKQAWFNTPENIRTLVIDGNRIFNVSFEEEAEIRLTVKNLKSGIGTTKNYELFQTNRLKYAQNTSSPRLEKFILLVGLLETSQNFPVTVPGAPLNALNGNTLRSSIEASNHRLLKTKNIREKYYKAFEQNDLLAPFYFVLNSDNPNAPDGADKIFKKWCDDNNIDLTSILLDYELPDLNRGLEQENEQEADLPIDLEDIQEEVLANTPQIPEALKDKLVTIDAPTKWGDGDELYSIDTSPREPQAPKDLEFRWHIVMSLLGEIGITPDHYNKIYRLSQTEHLLDITTRAGRSLILVDDYKDVFIIRDEGFTRKDLPFHRSPSYKSEGEEDVLYLLDRSDTFKYAMHSQEQLKNDIEDTIRTPLENLPEQPKHQVAWANNARGTQLMNSLVSTVIATGQMPKTDKHARRIQFEFGPLANVQGATHAKGYNALSNKSIPMFRDAGITTYKGLWQHAVETIGWDLEGFLKEEPLHATDVIKTVGTNIIEGRDIKDMSNAFGSAARKQESHINLAIKYKGLHSINKAIGVPQNDEELIEDIKDFNSLIEASGLAVRLEDGSEWMTIDPEEAQGLLDKIELLMG